MEIPKVVAIVQARMGSTRYPGKVLRCKIGSTTLLGHVLGRLGGVSAIHKVVVATTTLPEDDEIVDYIYRGPNWPWRQVCFRGPVDDVLARYYYAAMQNDAGLIVRITADDPFKDLNIVYQVIKRAQREYSPRQPIYVSNNLTQSYPEGYDVEVFCIGALQRAHHEAFAPFAREHVTPFMRTNNNIRQISITNSILKRHRNTIHNPARWRLTIDTPEDAVRMKRLYDACSGLGGFAFNLGIIQKALQDYPLLREVLIASPVQRQKYAASLKLRTNL